MAERVPGQRRDVAGRGLSGHHLRAEAALGTIDQDRGAQVVRGSLAAAVEVVV